MSCVGLVASCNDDTADERTENDAGVEFVDACCECDAVGAKCGSTNQGTCRNYTCYHWCVTVDGGMSYAIESCSNPCTVLGLKTWEN